MMRLLLSTAGCLLAAGALAFPAPKISNVVTAAGQGPKGRLTVNYTLSEDAIVLCDVLTNVTGTAEGDACASIGAAHLTAFAGDIGHKVAAGNRSFEWMAGADWPSNKIDAAAVRVKLTAYPTNRPPQYLVVDLAPESAERVRYYASASDIPGFPESDLYRTQKLVMRFIRAKNIPWTMGAIAENSTETYRAYEQPHTVRLRSNYWIGVFEMTVGQHAWFTDGDATSKASHMPLCRACVYNDVRGQNALYPAKPAATSHLGALNARTDIDFDLPSESQWEYAARANHGENLWGDGTEMTTFNLTNGIGQAVISISNGALERAGSRKPNDWGLYDMMGNVVEYCLDWMQKDITWNTNGIANAQGTFLTDGETAGKTRVLRGGCYASKVSDVRPAYRYSSVDPAVYADWTGYRVVSTFGIE